MASSGAWDLTHDARIVPATCRPLAAAPPAPAGRAHAASSVVDRWARAHDHEHLWITGAPVHVSASCRNGTLTFAAVGLRTAAAIARAR